MLELDDELEDNVIPSAAAVLGPTIPSTERPFFRWKYLTASFVSGP